ncbi:TlpA family protein disulfide reductase [Flexithrix dorotheae]|uniref:TlpA family protein disulfide reductase n=1 Tax=Flexithrix dorotheae TaxID=70993 RepID=UPI0005C4881B|nr:TlpA disulfide reductase family protein [Flexithrix dorotheae]
MSEKAKKKKKSTKREFIELGIIVGIFAFIFLTGIQSEVAGFLQRAVLETGIHNGHEEIPVAEQSSASYNFRLADLEGNELSLEELKGKIVFMNFWATWCPPCIAEMPSIQELYDNTADSNIIFLMISTDEDETKIRKFIEKKGYTFPVYRPASVRPEVYSSNSIPTTFVISLDGKIVYKNVGIANYNSDSFKKLLSNLTKESQ